MHDELIVEIPENDVADVAPKLKEIMENIVQLKVPLVVDIGIGDNWDAAHG